MAPRYGLVLGDSIRSGAVLTVSAIALAMLGLTPASTWIPEVPLLGTAVLLPIVILIWAGFRAASRSGRLAAGFLTAAPAGAIGGAVAGAALGFAGALAQRSSRRI